MGKKIQRVSIISWIFILVGIFVGVETTPIFLKQISRGTNIILAFFQAYASAFIFDHGRIFIKQTEKLIYSLEMLDNRFGGKEEE